MQCCQIWFNLVETFTRCNPLFTILTANKVLHMRDQIQKGLAVADAYMEKRMLMVCSDKNVSQSFGGLLRRALSDSAQHLDATDANKTHYLGFVDLTKFGRLSAITVNEVATWCHQLLNQNPEYSTLVLNIPCPTIFRWYLTLRMFECPTIFQYVLKILFSLSILCKVWSSFALLRWLEMV